MQYQGIFVRLITLLLLIISLYACSDAASRASVSRPIDPIPPPVPTDLTVTVNETNGTVTLVWSEVPYTFNLDTPTYNIYWNTVSSVSKNDNKIENIISPHVVEGLVEGTVYYFVIASEAVNLQSEISFEVTATAPLPVLVKINISPENASLANDTTLQYSATGHYSNDTTIDITSSVNWETLDSNLAIFDNNSNGLAIAKSTGTTSISATDTITNVIGSTGVRIQLNHKKFGNPLLSCDSSGCHTMPIDHINTTVLCVSCHLDSEPFKWKPKFVPNHSTLTANCVTCHNGTLAVDKAPSHIQTSNLCDACHSIFPSSWFVAPSAVDHLQVVGICLDCHIGTITVARANNHIPTSDECATCHSTTSWSPEAQTDHKETIGVCFSCHNGYIASGKTFTHIRSLDVCDKCHITSTVSWVPVASSEVDHTQVLGGCFDCHNNVVALGKTTTHISSTNICDDCHIILNWITIKTPP